MLIPNGPAGTDAEDYPTLYPSRLRAYGAAPEHDRFRGCPAQYAARYVLCGRCGHDRGVHLGACAEEGCGCESWRSSVVEIVEADNPRDFGGAIHDALFRMEEEAIGPDQALQDVWPATQGPERFEEALDLLERYLERGGPMNRYATLAVEVELVAPLYVDDDFGPVYFGGIIDWLGLDVNESQVVHHSDYKSNQQPLKPDEVRQDLQLRGYDWLIHQNWAKLGLPGRPHTVAHMDGIRWNDVEVRYSDNDRAMWAEWAAAVARTILRDEEAEEILTPGCRWCPVRLECSAYRELPGVGASIATRARGSSLEDLWAWRTQAAEARKALDDGIKDVDRIIGQAVRDDGPVAMDGQQWTEVDDVKSTLSVKRLHSVIGDDLFYANASVTKKATESLAKAHPELAEQIAACWYDLVTGTKVERKKVKG